MIGCAAHLRVYEPLGALPDEERARWSAYVESGTTPSRAALMSKEQEAAVAAAMAVPPRVDVTPAGDQAYVRHLDGLTYICPWRLQPRAWEALEEFRATLPDDKLAEAFLPLPVVVAAELEHDAWVAANPDVSVGIRTCTWSVPIPWFALFEAEERRLVLGARKLGDGQAAGAPAHVGLDRALVYLTAMSRARRRAARALHVVRKAFEDTPAVDAIDDLGRWLEEFHPHSLVELDYGGIVHLLDDETLAADDSVGEIAAALDYLAEGDIGAAGSCYENVLARWRAIASLEHAN